MALRGIGPSPQGSSRRKRHGAGAPGAGMSASNAGSGPIPLRSGGRWGPSPQGSSRRKRHGAGAPGAGMSASNAGSGPIPLRWCVCGLRGTGPAFAGNVGASGAFALAREGEQDVDVPMLTSDRSRFAGGGFIAGYRSVARRGNRGRGLARGRFGRMHTARWRLLIVPRSGPGGRLPALPTPAPVLDRGPVPDRVLRHRRCRRWTRRIGRRPGSGSSTTRNNRWCTRR
jgi:hypothetical protein